MIKAVIFDLDNCILDSFSTVMDVLKPIYDYVDRSGLPQRQALKDDLLSKGLDTVAEKHDLGERYVRDLHQLYVGLEAPKELVAYDDVAVIKSIRAKRFLVTTGFSRLQSSKVDHLGIRSWFDEVAIDTLDAPDKAQGKKAIFRDIAERYRLASPEVMVVGDSARSELKAGKELGMVTVQTLRPRVRKAEGFDYYVRDFHELKRILEHR
jgi:putative hydrolase of the HAD superfamily